MGMLARYCPARQAPSISKGIAATYVITPQIQ